MPSETRLPEGVPPLTTYYMYVAGGCNLACRHCWITPTFLQNGDHGQCLDYQLYELAIEQALPLGLNVIKFTGGEPLLHPDFVRMVDYATEKGVNTWLETNGTLVTLELAKHLTEKTSLYFVSVSLDGATAKSHEYIRNVTGSFEMAKRGIGYLVEAGFHPQVIMSLYPGNVNEVEPLVRWAATVGCGSVKFNLIQSSGRGEQMQQRGDWLSVQQQIELGRWIERDLQRRSSIPLLYSWPMAFHGIERLHRGVLEICNIHSILGVLSTGDLAMCGIGTQEEELIYGRLGIVNVAEIWTSNPVLRQMRESIPNQLEGICRECILKKRCLGSCVAQNYYESRRLTGPNWFCHLADGANLFPASRRRDAGMAARQAQVPVSLNGER